LRFGEWVCFEVVDEAFRHGLPKFEKVNYRRIYYPKFASVAKSNTSQINMEE
jgi:hypothetical protein